jgi:hypothetical protein
MAERQRGLVFSCRSENPLPTRGADVRSSGFTRVGVAGGARGTHTGSRPDGNRDGYYHRGSCQSTRRRRPSAGAFGDNGGRGDTVRDDGTYRLTPSRPGPIHSSEPDRVSARECHGDGLSRCFSDGKRGIGGTGGRAEPGCDHCVAQGGKGTQRTGVGFGDRGAPDPRAAIGNRGRPCAGYCRCRREQGWHRASNIVARGFNNAFPVRS